MAVNKLEKMKCTGCYACYNICPNNCISMEKDFEGFYYPKIDIELCTNCGLCESRCPILNKVKANDKFSIPTVYAAWSLNDEIRVNSTSGGIFSELAINILNKGGNVCGAMYGEYHKIEHSLINSVNDLALIRQSKYAQSDVGIAYRKIKELLNNNETVLFCGTPCQCAGLINFLNKKYENLVIIDFVCRGANSPKVYEKFLNYLEETHNSKVKKVWFKNKTYGWNRFSTKVEFEDGQNYLEDRYNDLYIVGYIKYNLYMRPSCADCQYKQFPRVSDITLADFWGIKLSNNSLDIEKGTSLVMINSSKGRDIFEQIKANIFCESKSLDDTLSGNPSILKSPVMNPKRNYFFKNLDTMPYDKLMKKCCKETFSIRTIRKTKRILKRFI
jgi:Coenzyme F420-reducing hydrogenase, beta subunit